MRAINKDIIWQLFGTLSGAFIQLLVTIIAAHNLDNSQISFFSIITLFLGFVSTFIENGVQQYVIRNGISKNNLSGLYCINLTCFVITLLMVFVYCMVGDVSSIEMCSLLILPCALLCSGIYSVGTAINYRNKNYKEIALFQIYARLISCCTLIVLVLNGFNNVFIYALNYFLNYFIIYVFYYQRVKCVKIFSVKAVNMDCIKYSSDTILSQLFVFIRGQIDVILINIFFSKDIVASYFLVKQISGRVIDIIASVYVKEAFPKLCSAKSDLSKLTNIISVNNRFYIFAQAGVFVFIFLCNDYISYYLLNRKPEELKLYFISGTLVFFIRSIQAIIPNVCLALGESRVVLKWNAYVFIVTTTVSLISTSIGYNCYIMSIAITNMLLYVWIFFYLLKRFLPVKNAYMLFDLYFALLFLIIYLFDSYFIGFW